MRRRCYFVLPDVETARKVEDELLLARIPDRHIHFIARDEARLKDLPRANLAQRSDIVHGMELGLITGGATGAVAGLLAYLEPAVASWLGLGIVLVLGLAGALIGIWTAGMIGISIPNSRLSQFEKPLSEGQVLLMVDVPRDQIDAITRLIQGHHPDARSHGVEPTIPAFP